MCGLQVDKKKKGTGYGNAWDCYGGGSTVIALYNKIKLWLVGQTVIENLIIAFSKKNAQMLKHAYA